MNAASDTTQAMSQGLAFGVHAEAGFGLSTVVLTVVWGGLSGVIVGDVFGNYETSIFVTIVVDAGTVSGDSKRFGGRGESEGRSSTGGGGARGRASSE